MDSSEQTRRDWNLRKCAPGRRFTHSASTNHAASEGQKEQGGRFGDLAADFVGQRAVGADGLKASHHVIAVEGPVEVFKHGGHFDRCPPGIAVAADNVPAHGFVPRPDRKCRPWPDWSGHVLWVILEAAWLSRYTWAHQRTAYGGYGTCFPKGSIEGCS